MRIEKLKIICLIYQKIISYLFSYKKQFKLFSLLLENDFQKLFLIVSKFWPIRSWMGKWVYCLKTSSRFHVYKVKRSHCIKTFSQNNFLKQDSETNFCFETEKEKHAISCYGLHWGVFKGAAHFALCLGWDWAKGLFCKVGHY